MKDIICADETQLNGVVKDILEYLNHKVVLFIGDLGAGKTTIIKNILKHLKCEDIGSSPSYSLINEYKSPDGPIFHIDLYRLDDAEEAFNLGIEDYLYSGNYVFVEWPQIIKEYIDDPYHIIKIEIVENNKRKIEII